MNKKFTIEELLAALNSPDFKNLPMDQRIAFTNQMRADGDTLSANAEKMLSLPRDHLGGPKQISYETQQTVLKTIDRLVALEKLNSARAAYAYKPREPKVEQAKIVQPRKTNDVPYPVFAKDKTVSWIVNDFVSKYIASDSTSPEKFWSQNMLDSDRIYGQIYNANYKQQGLDLIKSMETRLGGIDKVRKHYEKYHYSNKTRTVNNLPISSDLLVANSEVVIFANNTRKESTLAKAASKFFHTYPDIHKLDYVTPTGTKSFSKKESMITGQLNDYPIEVPFDITGRAQQVKERLSNVQAYYRPLAPAVDKYNLVQDSLEIKAKQQLLTLAKMATQEMSEQYLDNFMRSTTLKELKSFGAYFGDSFSDLSKFNRYDSKKLSSVLSSEDLFSLQLRAREAKDLEASKQTKGAFSEAFKTAKQLDIPFSLVKKEALRGTGGNLSYAVKNLGPMNAFLKDSLEAQDLLKGQKSVTRLEAVNARFPNREAFIASLKLTGTKGLDAAKEFANNMSNHAWLESRGLLDDTAINPILNLKGYVQEAFSIKLGKALSPKFKSGTLDIRTMKIEPELLELMAAKKLDIIKSKGPVLKALYNRLTTHNEIAKEYESAGFKGTNYNAISDEFTLGSEGIALRDSADSKLASLTRSIKSRLEKADAEAENKGEKRLYTTDAAYDKAAHDKALASLGDGFQVDKGLSLKAQFFNFPGTATSDELITGSASQKDLSRFLQLKEKIKNKAITFGDHQELLQIANAFGISTQGLSGSKPDLRKIVSKLNSIEADYFANLASDQDKVKSPYIHVGQYLRDFAYESANLTTSSKLGLIRNNGDVARAKQTRLEPTYLVYGDKRKETLRAIFKYLKPKNDLDTDMFNKDLRAKLVASLRVQPYVTDKMVSIASGILSGKADKSVVVENLAAQLMIDKPDNAKLNRNENNIYFKTESPAQLTRGRLEKARKYEAVLNYFTDPKAKSLVDSQYARDAMPGDYNFLAPHLDAIDNSALATFPIRGANLSTFVNKLANTLYSGYAKSLTDGPEGKKQTTTMSIAYKNAMISLSQDLAKLRSGSAKPTAEVISKLRAIPMGNTAYSYFENDMARLINSGSALAKLPTEYNPSNTVERPIAIRRGLDKVAKAELEKAFGISEGVGPYGLPVNKVTRQAELDYFNTSLSEGSASPLRNKSLFHTAYTTDELAYKLEKQAATRYGNDSLKRKKELEKFYTILRKPFSKNKYSTGGKIPGKGTKDEVPALLMKGEVVVDRDTSEKLGIHTNADYERFKGAVKEGSISLMADGGLISPEEQEQLNFLNSQAELDAVQKATLEKLNNKISVASRASAEEPMELPRDKPASKANSKSIIDSLNAEISAQVRADEKAFVESKVSERPKSKTSPRESLSIEGIMKELGGPIAQDKEATRKAIADKKAQIQAMSFGEIGTESFRRDLDTFGFKYGDTASNAMKPFIDLSQKAGIFNSDDSIGSLSDTKNSAIISTSQYKALTGVLDKESPKYGDALKNLKDRTETANAAFITHVSDMSTEAIKAEFKDPAKTSMYIKKGTSELAKNPKLRKSQLEAINKMGEALVGAAHEEIQNGLANGITLDQFSPKAQSAIADLYKDPNTLSAYSNLSGGANAKQLLKIADPDAMSKMNKTMTLVNSNLDTFNKLFGTQTEKLSNPTDVNDLIKKVSSINSGFDISGRAKNAQEMGLARDMIKSLNSSVDPNADATTKNKMEELDRQVATSQVAKERSQMRWANFSDLTIQNAAFGASYAVLGGTASAVTGTARFIADLDEKMKNLQAITASTSPEIAKMGEAVKLVSTETKFSAGEIADAATILGQAGFSAQDITDSLSGVVKLATATGSNLEDATQTLTSALTIWDAPIRSTDKMANQFTAAINKSKLDMNSLSLALQYAGNIASEGDIPVEDLLTVTSLMKDAGVRSGSTVGTGQRLVYSDVISPTPKFTKSLSQVGLSKSEFTDTFEEEGILGALKKMKSSGYGFSQASTGMELREKSAYMAMINQLDKAFLFRNSIMGTNAADEANSVQMSSFNNQVKNMFNSWGIALDNMFGDNLKSLGKVAEAVTYNPEGSSKNLLSKSNTFTEAAGGSAFKWDTNSILGAAAGVGTLGGLAYTYGKSDSKVPGAISKTKGFLGKHPVATSTLGTAGLGLLWDAAVASQSDNPMETFVKSLPKTVLQTLVGVAVGSGTSNPYIGMGAYAGTGMLYDSFAKEPVDSLINMATGWGNPAQGKILETGASALSAGSGTMSDLFKYEKEVGKEKNNPLKAGKNATILEQQVAASNTASAAASFNKQFEAEIKLLKETTGEEFSFLNFAKDNVELAKSLKDFASKYKADVLNPAVDKLHTEFVAAAANDINDIKGDTFGAQLSNVKSKFDKAFKDISTAAPTKLLQNQEIYASAVDRYVEKVRTDAIKALSSETLTPKQFQSKIESINAEAEQVKSSLKTNLKGQAQLGYSGMTNPADVLEFSKALISEYDAGKLGKTELVQQLKGAETQYKLAAEDFYGIDKLKGKIVDLAAKIEPVNDAYKEFFKQSRNAVAEKAVEVGRAYGSTVTNKAITLGETDWKDLNSLKSAIGKTAISGIREAWLKASPTDLGDQKSFGWEFGNARYNVPGALSKGATQASSREFMSVLGGRIEAMSMPDLPNSIGKLIETFGQDSFMLKQFFARQDKLEQMGFKPEGDLEGISKMSVEDLVNTPIDGLKKNLTDGYLKQLDFNKQMAIKNLTVQEAQFKEVILGGETVPVDQSEKAYSLSRNKLQYDQNVASMGRQTAFQKQQVLTNYERSLEDLTEKFAFQRQELVYSLQSQLGGISRQANFQRQMAKLSAGYARADALTSAEDSREDAGKRRNYAIDDLSRATRQKTEDAYRSLTRSLEQLAIGFERATQSIERAMDFAKVMFDRQMDKPVNVTLNSEAFMKIADVMNDNTLAIEAHKAELGVNTTAIKQLIGIQTAKEDLSKEAYKYAYKAVGGEVYTADGQVNSEFTSNYNNYLQNNSEGLLDTVLNQALDRAMSSGSFDATAALTDPSYMANAVANPGPATTVDSIVQGSQYSVEDFVNALFGEAPGEIRLTTSQGIVLQAQGDLAGAIFDLETQMMQYENQLAEAAISYSQAIEDAKTSLRYALEDIGINFQRGLENIELNYQRDLEAISTNFQRNLEQIELNLSRSLEQISLQEQFQMQEALIHFQEALAALARQEAFNKEQLQQNLEDALEDIVENSEFKLSEAAINNEQNEQAISEGFSRLLQKKYLDTEMNKQALEEQMNDMIRKSSFDYQVFNDMFTRSLKQSIATQLPDLGFMLVSMNKGLSKAAEEMEWQFSGIVKDIEQGFQKVLEDPKVKKQIEGLGGKTIEDLLRGLVSGAPVSIQTVLDSFSEPIKTAYTTAVGNWGEALKESTVKEAAGIEESTRKLLGAATQIESAYGSFHSGILNITNEAANLGQEVAKVAQQAASSMASMLTQLQGILAQARSTGTGYSIGGILPGYGGGDIIPAMLEPGEAIIRKEAVKSLGQDLVRRLNNPSVNLADIAELAGGSLSGVAVMPATQVNNVGGTTVQVGINVAPEMSIKSIQDNIEQIADGVKKVFQEYM